MCILLSKATNNRKQTFNSQKISSPKVLNQFAPAGRVIRRNIYLESVFSNSKAQMTVEADIVKKSREVEILEMGMSLENKGKNRETFTTCSLLQAAHASKVTDANLLINEKKSILWEEPALDSPGIVEEAKNLQSVVVYCSCGRISRRGLGVCDECWLLDKSQETSGYLYVEKDEKNVDRYWFSLVNTDLYCTNIIQH